MCGVFRVTNIGETGSIVTLKVEGEVAAPVIRMLESECAAYLVTHGQLVLDFADVTYVDRAGAEGVRRLQARGVGLINCRSLMRDWIRG